MKPIKARQFTPTEVSTFSSKFKLSVEGFDAVMPSLPVGSQELMSIAVSAKLQNAWTWLVRWGTDVATWVVETRTIPKGKEKAVELAARLFTMANRSPKDIPTWWDKNEKHIHLLVEALSWPERTEGSLQEKFSVGPFTVHNTLHLEEGKLQGTVSVIVKAMQKIKPFHKFNKVLYGDVFVVGQLRHSKSLAWYYNQDDTVYLRPQKTSEKELVNLIHELGHRYWYKFLGAEAQRQWHSVYTILKRPVQVKLPEVGEPLGVLVKGVDNPIVESYGRGNKGVPIVTIVGGQVFSATGVLSILEAEATERKFPTPYSATSVEEFFAEAFAHYIVGDLSEDHRVSLEGIINP